jgi:hypothetical protein
LSVVREFRQLNIGWNADPNVPDSRVTSDNSDVMLRFTLNSFVFDRFRFGERGTLRFTDCSRYRLGGTNDEGWYLGQCRYSKIAPQWGEFYEIVGDDPLRYESTEWVTATGSGRDRHFLFYLRDGTFECIADDWAIEPRDDNALYRVVGQQR